MGVAGDREGTQAEAGEAVDCWAMKAPEPPLEVVFIGEQSPQGGFTAHAVGESIYTEADTLDGLRANIREVRHWAQARHGVQLAAATAARLLERLAGDLGQVDQAIARLAAGCTPAERGKPIQPEAVDDFAGSPQERTAWGMIDAAAGGDTKRALSELADLLDAGENPIGIAAQIASVLRRLSTAARLLALPAAAGRPAGVEQALREAGVAAWPKAMAQAKESLGQLGPRRARQLPIWLLDLDRALKGDASRGLRARLALERLFCKMARRDEPRRPNHPGARR